MKRLKLFFVAMLLSAVAINSWGYVNGDRLTIDDITYQVTNAKNNLVSVVGVAKSGDVVIPATVFDGKDITFTVDAIGTYGAVTWKPGVTSLTLPNTLKRIQRVAFYNCDVETINIPASVIEMSPASFGNQHLVNINVDEGNSVYSSYDGIVYSKDGKNLFRVPQGKNYTEYQVKDGVENILTLAFDYCTTITKLIFPATVKTVYMAEENEFVRGCNNLAYIEVDDANPYLCDDDGVLFDKEMSTLIYYPVAKTDESYKVPDGVENLGTLACYSAKFKTVDLNDATTIGNKALYQCNNLETIYIPEGVSEIPEGSIDGKKMQNYIVDENNEYYSSIDGVLYTKDKDVLLQFPIGRTGSYTIPTGYNTTTIGARAFLSSNLTSIEITEGITTINEYAFWGCKKVSEFVIPEGVTSIGEYSFSNTGATSITFPSTLEKISGRSCAQNSNLTTVIFPNGSNPKELGSRAFEEDKNLTSFTLPKSVTTLGSSLFIGCANLEEVIVPDGSELTAIPTSIIQNCPKCTKFTFEGSCPNLTSINQNAFSNSALESFELPASVTNIAESAFSNCKDLKTITFVDNPDVSLNIAAGAFADSGIESISLPSQVNSLGKEAFRNCDVLESVSLSKATTSVSPEAFKFCSSLKEITVDKENPAYSSSDGILLSKDKTVLRIFPEGKANSNFTLLPPSITSIGDYSFYYCEKLENVTIPNKVAQIGKRAFGLCTNLNTVTFLCDEMIDPANIAQALNEAAFDDVATAGTDCFDKITINVRKELLSDYQNNEYYQKFKEIKPSFIDETTRVGGLNKTQAKEEYIAVSQNTVDLLSVDTDDETYVLPTTVENEGTSYNVGLVGDYLFTANGSQVSNVKEVVVPGNVQYIGARAFMTDAALSSRNSNVESVFLIGDQLNEDLLSTARFELAPEDLGSSRAYYDEFGEATKIYVRKSAEDTYKTAWTNYADNISYKIPYTQSGTFGTFAREFDVDFSEVNGVNAEKPVTDDPVLIAFTGNGKYVESGDSYFVQMTSINLGDQEGKDGTYVPAGSGVLMKKYKDAEEELYYQIAETGISDAFVEGNFMKGITVRSESISKNNGYNRYYISGDKLHEMTKATTFKNHKSFLEIDTSDIPAGAKVSLSFTDWNDIEATGIESINDSVNYNDNLYNLQGQRVNNAGKGIYIKNGKKILVK